MEENEELLPPPPPKKKADISVDGDLLPPPPKKKSLAFGSELPFGKNALNAPAPSVKNISQSKLPSTSIPNPKEIVSKIKEYGQNPNIQLEQMPETDSYISRLGDRAIRGMNSLNANLAKTHEFIYNLAAMPQNIVAEQLDIESLATSAEKVKKDLNISNDVAQYYDNEVKKLAYLDNKYSSQQGSIVNLVKSGKYKDAAKLLGEQIVESLPTTAAIAATGGLGATPTAITLGGGAVFGAAKYDEIKDREDLTEAEKASISFSTGLVEGLFENIGTANLGRVAKEIFLKEGAETAAKQLKQTFVDTYKEALKKYMPISGAVSEGIEEAGTQFAQNAIDIYGGVDPEKKITDGVIDAFIVGTGSGAVISSPTLLSRKRNKEVVEKQAEVENIDKDLENENISQPTKDALIQERQTKMQEINTLLDEDVLEQKNLPEDAKREIEDLYEQSADLDIDLEQEVSETTKAAIEKKKQAIEKRINEITNEVQQPNQLSPTDVGQQLETTTTEQSNVGNLEGTGGELTGVDSSVQESEPTEGSIVNEPKTSIDEAQKTENLQTESEPNSNVGEVNGQEPTVPTESEGLTSDALKGVEIQSKIDEIMNNDDAVYEKLTKLNKLDVDEIDSIKIPSDITNTPNWQEKLVEFILDEIGIEKTKNTAGTGTVYYSFDKSDGDSFKLRLADHDKGANARYNERKTDGDIVFDENSSVEDIVEQLKNELRGKGVAMPENKIAENYLKRKDRYTNDVLVKAVEELLGEPKETKTEVSLQPEGESKPKLDEKAERKRKIEILDTEKKIAQLEKEMRTAPVRPRKGVASKKQLRIYIKNYKDQLRDLKGLKPKKKVTDSVLRINLRKFGTQVDETNLPHEERVVLEAIGRLDANDADIKNSDGNAKLRMQSALKSKGGDSIDQIVTDYINENELDESMASDLRNAIISFVQKGDTYKWMDSIRERESQTDPDAIREDEYYNYGYEQAMELDMTDEEISELEQEIGKLNDLTQDEYEQLKQQFSESNTEAGEGINQTKSATDSSKAERKKIAEAKIDEVADKAKEFLNKYLAAKGIDNIKLSGIGQNKVVDILANMVKTLVNAGIEINEAIKEVRTFFESEYDTSEISDFDIKMTIAKDGLKADLEKAGISYRQAIFIVKKHLREVGAEDVITKEDLEQALKNKAEQLEKSEKKGGSKTRKHYETMMNYVQNLPETVQAYFKANPMGYKALSNGTLLKEAIEYIKEQGIDKNGNPNAYEKFMSGEIASELSPAHEVAVGFLLRGAISNQYNELTKELKEDPTNEDLQKQIDILFNRTNALAKRIGEGGTSYGQAVQAFSLFAQNLTDEVSALFYFGKMVEKMATESKKSSTYKTKEYKDKANNTIKEGKKKAAKETAEYATKKYKPKARGSERVKQYKEEAKEAATKLKDAFAKYKNVGVFYNGWEEAKKDIEVMKALRDYVKAQAKYKAVQVQQIIKEVAEMLGVDVKLIDEETISEIITTAKKDSDAEKVLESVEKERLKRIQNQAKESAKEDESKRMEEKRLSDLIALENIRIAELQAKEKQLQQDRIEKERLKRIQNQIKESQKKIKELEAQIEKLAKEIVDDPKVIEKTFEGIIEDYYNGEQSLEALEQLIKDRFTVTDAQAKDLAKKLQSSIETNIRAKLIKQMGREVEKAEKKLKDEPKPEKKQRKDVYQLLIEAHMMGVLNDGAIQEIISPMFNIPKMTQEDIAFVREAMKKYLETGDAVRKAELISKMIKHFNKKAPLSLLKVYDSFWYSNVLSGSSTFDVNLIFGDKIIQLATLEYSMLQLTKVLSLSKKSVSDRKQELIRGLYGYYRAIFQSGNKTPKELLNIKNWDKGDIPLVESYENVRSVLAFGNEVFMQELKDIYYNNKMDIDLRDLTKKQSGLSFLGLSLLNAYVKGVPRTLNAIDLAFSTPLKNLFLVPSLEEYYKKQGLTGEELTKAIENNIFNTQEEVLKAKALAKKDRLSIDISVEKKGDKWVVTDSGAIFGKTKSFATEQEAIEYIDKIASEGAKYNKGVLDYLNAKLPVVPNKEAKRIASRYLLTSEPEGSLGSFYDKWIMPFKIVRQQKYLDSENNWLSRGANFAADKMLVFLRVPFNMFNLAVDSTPAGFYRYKKGGIINNYKRLEYSQVEKDLVLRRALIGTSVLAYLLYKQLITQLSDDDDEKETKRKQEALERWKAKYPNSNLDIKNPIFNLPKDGEIIGSLDFLDPNKKKFLIENNLAKPFSIYNAKTDKWVNYETSPLFLNYAMVSAVSNYNKYIIEDNTKFTTGQQKKQEFGEFVKFFWSNSTGLMLNISGLKNQQKQITSLSSGAQAADKMVDLATSGVQVNPAFVRQTVQNFDGFMRKRIEFTKEPIKYSAQRFIPIGGSFILGEKMYDMHGEEMPFVYGYQKGGVLGYAFDKMYGEKEKQRMELANWYNINGYNRFRDFVKENASKTVVAKVGDSYEDVALFEDVDDKTLNKYGKEAGKLAKETVIKNRELLQKIANINTDNMLYKKSSFKLPFSKGVDLIFSAAFRLKFKELAYEKGYISKQRYEIEKKNFEYIQKNLQNLAVKSQKEIEFNDADKEVNPISLMQEFGFIQE